MPRLSKADEERQPDLRKSLDDLRRCMTLLERSGSSRRAVAQASNLTPGYLAQLLAADSERAVPTRLVEKLVRGIGLVAERCEQELRDGLLDEELEELLVGVEERLGVARVRHSSPGGVIRLDAPAYICRDCDTVADSLIGAPGDFLIAGPPQSGRSTLARKIEATALARGHQVAFVDMALVSGAVRSGELGVAAGIVEQLVGHRVDHADASDVYEPLEAWLASSRKPSLLILDNLNAGHPDVVRAAGQVLRGWHNKRGSALPANDPYRRLATWAVMTTAVTSARYASSVSLGLGTHVETSWFTRDQVRQLAEVYPVPPNAGVRKVVEEARLLFGGQPLLTHHYLHGRSTGAVAPEQLQAKPSGVFEDHLLFVAGLVVLDPDSLAAVETADSGDAAWTLYLENWGVVRTGGMGWSCSFYRDHLPFYVNEARRRADRRRGDADDG